jgi:hypothetical protein
MYHTRAAQYNSRETENDECIRQICCHPKLNAEMAHVLNECKTLKEMAVTLKSELKQQIMELKMKIVDTQESVNYFMREVLAYSEAYGLNKTEKDISSNWARVALKKERTALTRQTNLLERLKTAYKLYESNTMASAETLSCGANCTISSAQTPSSLRCAAERGTTGLGVETPKPTSLGEANSTDSFVTVLRSRSMHSGPK